MSRNVAQTLKAKPVVGRSYVGGLPVLSFTRREGAIPGLRVREIGVDKTLRRGARGNLSFLIFLAAWWLVSKDLIVESTSLGGENGEL